MLNGGDGPRRSLLKNSGGPLLRSTHKRHRPVAGFGEDKGVANVAAELVAAVVGADGEELQPPSSLRVARSRIATMRTPVAMSNVSRMVFSFQLPG